MTDNEKDLEKGNPDENPSLEQVKELQQKLNNQNEAAKRTAEAKTAIEKQLVDAQAKLEVLEKANQEPKEDSERIANLEVQLARSQAVSRYGLSTEDANLLKGSPDDILKDAEYWADRLKDTKPEPKKEDDKTNRQIIDEKVETPPTKPDPKKGNLSWLETYKMGTPAERYKMDQDVLNGRVDPTK